MKPNFFFVAVAALAIPCSLHAGLGSRKTRNRDCEADKCSVLFGNYGYLSSSPITTDSEYEGAKKLVAECECYPGMFSNEFQASTYRNQLAALPQQIAAYEAKQAELKKHAEINAQRAAEQASQRESAIRQQAAMDSIRKIEREQEAEEQRLRDEIAAKAAAKRDSIEEATLRNEIKSLITSGKSPEECYFKCEDYRIRYGQELPSCTEKLPAMIRNLTPRQIMSEDVAKIRFTPQTDFREWYLDGKLQGYVHFLGRVAWVSDGLAEVNSGSRIAYLIRQSGWTIREGLNVMGIAKPIGNVTYQTALGGKRTLPCLKVIWLYRPNADKTRDYRTHRLENAKTF
jgi:hypothetical protein